jgi:transcription initiation factor TFIIF subunit beta
MEINVNKKDKKVSIGKFPAFLGDRLLNMDKKTYVGDMIIGDDDTFVFKMQPNFDDIDNFPTDYSVKKIQRGNNMYVVNSDISDTFIEGEVDFEYYITPNMTKKYLDFKKKQSKIKNLDIRNSEIIDYVSEGRRNEKIGSLRELEYLAKKRKKMLLEKKRERLGKNEALDIVFNAFEKYSSWTVKDLADFTGQPTAFIQEIVDEICVVNKKDHKNTYELKNEYK